MITTEEKGEHLSKYDNLSRFLRSAGPQARRLGFDEIESILGFSLPASARAYPAWWANDPAPNRHSQCWLSEGWMTADLDLAGGQVTFQRGEDTAVGRQRPNGPESGNGIAPMADLPAAPGGDIRVAIDMQWKHLGTVHTNPEGILAFPSAPAAPALYRLRFLGSSTSRHYVGETVNLRRRFGNYRNPGPTQQTSKRINEELRSHLNAGGCVEIDVIAAEIALSVAGQPCNADLADKATRRLLEQAALVCDSAAEIESLNR